MVPFLILCHLAVEERRDCWKINLVRRRRALETVSNPLILPENV